MNIKACAAGQAMTRLKLNVPKNAVSFYHQIIAAFINIWAK
jgi:hypothetical protein